MPEVFQRLYPEPPDEARDFIDEEKRRMAADARFATWTRQEINVEARRRYEAVQQARDEEDGAEGGGDPWSYYTRDGTKWAVGRAPPRAAADGGGDKEPLYATRADWHSLSLPGLKKTACGVMVVEGNVRSSPSGSSGTPLIIAPTISPLFTFAIRSAELSPM